MSVFQPNRFQERGNMSDPKQSPRHIAIETPLGDDVLLLRGFSVHEEISHLPVINLDLLSEDHEVDFDDIIGQNVTIQMVLPGGGRRYWTLSCRNPSKYGPGDCKDRFYLGKLTPLQVLAIREAIPHACAVAVCDSSIDIAGTWYPPRRTRRKDER